jgi:DNA polymerase III epsilon subunit-like protein
MKNQTRWIIVDTETDGLFAPVHVVEIAAQAMAGWEPCGPPFRVFLDHGIHIPPEATAVHGYTRDFLARNGIDPVEAHRRFDEYADGASIVCHNLSYDWNRALQPEWRRLGLSPKMRAGFCSMLLARRVIYETPRHNLDLLKYHFGIDTGRSHQAAADVATVVELFRLVMSRRLQAAGIDSFEDVCAFSRMTPVAKCHRRLRGCS